MTDFTKKSLYFVNAKAPVWFIDSTTDAHDGCIYHLVVVGENALTRYTAVSPIDEYDFGDGNKVDLNGVLLDPEGAEDGRNKAKHGIPIVLKYDCSTKTVTGVKALVQDFTTTAQDNDPTDESMVFNPATAAAENVPRNNGRIAVQGDKILVAVLLDTEQIYRVNTDGKIIVDGVEHTVSDKTTKTDPLGITVMFQLNRTNFKVVRIIEPGNPIGARRTMDNSTLSETSVNTDCIFDMVVDNGGYVYYMGMVGRNGPGVTFTFRAGDNPIEFKNTNLDDDLYGRRSTFLLKLNRKLEVIKAMHVGYLVTTDTTALHFGGDSFRRFTLALDASKLYLAGQTGNGSIQLSFDDDRTTVRLENLADNRPIVLAMNKDLQYSHHRFFGTDESDEFDRFTDIKVNGSGIFVCGLFRLNSNKQGGLPSSYYTEADNTLKAVGVFKLARNRNFDVLYHYYTETNRARFTDNTVALFNCRVDPQGMSVPVLELTPSGVFFTLQLSSQGLTTQYRSNNFFVPQEQSADGKLIDYNLNKHKTDRMADTGNEGESAIHTALFHLNMQLKVKKIDCFCPSVVSASDNHTLVCHTFKLVHSKNSLFGIGTVGGSTRLHELLVRDARLPSRPFRFAWDKLYDVNHILTSTANRDNVISGVFEFSLSGS